MDQNRFDSLARSLATAKTRRGLLGTLAALGAGLLGARGAGAQQVTQAYCGNVVCNGNGCACRAGCVCCTYSNGNSRCRPPGTCSPGQEVVPATTTTPAPTTTAAPTTTTTVAPTTTTTTTTARPTTTTTTTPHPLQGACPAGANSCEPGGITFCNGDPDLGCVCTQTFGGATFCANFGIGTFACSTTCQSAADCAGVGVEAECVVTAPGCGECPVRACVRPCPFR